MGGRESNENSGGKWKCMQCGQCCFMYGCMIPATDQDLERWKRQGRHDILEKVRVIRDPKTGAITAAECWFNPFTKKEYVYCPWIKRKGDKVFCLIHDTKPQYCIDYICRKHPK